MKKKVRNITVDGKLYSWSVVEKSWPNGVLKIWLEQDKNKLWLEIDVSVMEPIKPLKVIEIIRAKNIEVGTKQTRATDKR